MSHKASFLICACLETVIEVGRMRTLKPGSSSLIADRNCAYSWDLIGFNEFFVGEVAGATYFLEI